MTKGSNQEKKLQTFVKNVKNSSAKVVSMLSTQKAIQKSKLLGQKGTAVSFILFVLYFLCLRFIFYIF